jgi:hypothetical protein
MIAGTQSQDEEIKAAKKPMPKKLVAIFATLALVTYLVLSSITQWYSCLPQR